MNCPCRQGVISFGKTVNCARRELCGCPPMGIPGRVSVDHHHLLLPVTPDIAHPQAYSSNRLSRDDRYGWDENGPEGGPAGRVRRQSIARHAHGAAPGSR